MKLARRNLIDINQWWNSSINVPADALEGFHYAPEKFPNAEAAYQELILLPLDRKVSEREAGHIARFVCENGIASR